MKLGELGMRELEAACDMSGGVARGVEGDASTVVSLGKEGAEAACVVNDGGACGIECDLRMVAPSASCLGVSKPFSTC